MDELIHRARPPSTAAGGRAAPYRRRAGAGRSVRGDHRPGRCALGQILALFNFLKIDSWAVRGFALGTASHGIGAARALQVDPAAGAYSGIALGLQVLLASLLAPLLFRLL